jgi:hypothetical protein
VGDGRYVDTTGASADGIPKHLILQMGQGGIEPPTPAFSGLRSTD